MNEQKLIWCGVFGSGMATVSVAGGRLRWTHCTMGRPQSWETDLPIEGTIAAIGAGPTILYESGAFYHWQPWRWELLAADANAVAPTLQPAPPPIPPTAKVGAR